MSEYWFREIRKRSEGLIRERDKARDEAADLRLRLREVTTERDEVLRERNIAVVERDEAERKLRCAERAAESQAKRAERAIDLLQRFRNVLIDCSDNRVLTEVDEYLDGGTEAAAERTLRRTTADLPRLADLHDRTEGL